MDAGFTPGVVVGSTRAHARRCMSARRAPAGACSATQAPCGPRSARATRSAVARSWVRSTPAWSARLMDPQTAEGHARQDDGGGTADRRVDDRGDHQHPRHAADRRQPHQHIDLERAGEGDGDDGMRGREVRDVVGRGRRNERDMRPDQRPEGGVRNCLTSTQPAAPRSRRCTRGLARRIRRWECDAVTADVSVRSVDQAVMVGVPGRLGAVPDAELVVDVR